MRIIVYISFTYWVTYSFIDSFFQKHLLTFMMGQFLHIYAMHNEMFWYYATDINTVCISWWTSI